MVTCVQDLRNGCKESDIVSVFTTLNEQDEVVQDLEDVMIIIQNVIPISKSLKPTAVSLLCDVISRSPLIFAQLVACINSIEHTDGQYKNNTHGDTSNLYREILGKVFTTRIDCLFNNIISIRGNNVELQYVKSLFFGSKLFNILSIQISIVDYLESLNKQWGYICSNERYNKIPKLVQRYLADLLLAELILNPAFATDYLFDKLFFRNAEFYHFFLNIMKTANTIAGKKMVVKYLTPYLESKLNHNTLPTVFIILSNLSAFKLFDSNSLLSIKSHELQEIIIRNIPSVTGYSIFSSLASKFGFIDNRLDSNIARLLVMILTYTLSKEQRQEISHNSDFLQTVTKRLGSMDHDVRERTMYIAKLVSDNELKYESNFVIEIPNLTIDMDP
ncbi:telomere binding protein [Maudiozyma exigua]|uniref:Telomere binding protein n=1 Tax=Maudiozyma exigua TaxID=34358 RepID=A0A9P6WB52_MAUEX|nr:telomere binding protein [Kazachstania exigua]